MESDQSQLNSSLSLWRCTLHLADPNTTSQTLYSGFLLISLFASLNTNHETLEMKTGREKKKKKMKKKMRKSRRLKRETQSGQCETPEHIILLSSLSHRQPQKRWMWSRRTKYTFEWFCLKLSSLSYTSPCCVLQLSAKTVITSH